MRILSFSSVIEGFYCFFCFIIRRRTTPHGAVRRSWLHGLSLVVVMFITSGSLTVGLLLFLNLLPQFSVNGISAVDMLIGAALDHAGQSPK